MMRRPGSAGGKNDAGVADPALLTVVGKSLIVLKTALEMVA